MEIHNPLVGRKTMRRLALRASKRGTIDGEKVGFAALVVGALVAVGTTVAVIFVPNTTFTTLDAEMGAVIGVILVGIGVAAGAAN